MLLLCALAVLAVEADWVLTVAGMLLLCVLAVLADWVLTVFSAATLVLVS